MPTIFSALSTILRYVFITIIYLFIFGIIRMIFLDIKKMDIPRPRQIPKNMAYLQLLTDKKSLYFDVDSVYPLDTEHIIIGRSEKCDISINDLYMSTRHVQLWFEDGEWYIADLGSTNGTYINGRKMKDEPLILDSGDTIKIGQLEFLVVI
ncbi:MAG: FHA domain-containing protein [Eubacteriales bacterium]|jgi:hypothetical protein|nr:FHA domain-containing protein [Eubacteriales bacterium]